MITLQTIEKIAELDGGGLPILSAYVLVPKATDQRAKLRTRGASLLHGIRPQVEDGDFDREARLSLREDIERIDEALQNGDRRAGSAAFFACSGAGLFEEVALPRFVREGAVIDPTPWVRPLVAVLDEFHRCGVVVLNREIGQIWELFQDEIECLWSADDEVLRDDDHAGWYGLEEHGVHNRSEELAKRHFKRVAATVEKLCEQREFEILAVGGHHHEVPQFVESLPKALRPRVAGTFSIDLHTATPARIRDLATEVVEAYERSEERGLVDQLREQLGAGGLAVLGVEACEWAASLAAVEILLVQGERVEPGRSEPGLRSSDRVGPDRVDSLVIAVLSAGGRVEHVAPGAGLGDVRVGALLRFPIPPPPAG